MSDVSAERHKLYWLPNALTVSRILLIPILVWGIIWPVVTDISGHSINRYIHISIICLFVFCMITDFLDGYWARKWNLTSDFGRMLDPIADKLLVAACLISISITFLGTSIILIPALMIVARDIFVSGIREHAANSNVILSPTKLAKWKTMFEMLAILLYLFTALFSSRVVEYVLGEGDIIEPALLGSDLTELLILDRAFVATLWLAAILSAYTGFHYFRSAMRGKPTS